MSACCCSLAHVSPIPPGCLALPYKLAAVHEHGARAVCCNTRAVGCARTAAGSSCLLDWWRGLYSCARNIRVAGKVPFRCSRVASSLLLLATWGIHWQRYRVWGKSRGVHGLRKLHACSCESYCRQCRSTTVREAFMQLQSPMKPIRHAGAAGRMPQAHCVI
jgi:hypothetical protein